MTMQRNGRAVAMLPRGLALMVGLLVASVASANCEISFSHMEADLGQIVPAEVNPQHRISGKVSLGKQRGTLNIVCGSPTKLDLYFRAPAAGEQGYLVDVGGGEALLSLTLSHASADGRPVTLGSVNTPSVQGSSVLLVPDDGLRVLVDGAEAAVQGFSAQVEMDVSADVKTLVSNADRQLQGQGHFEAVERP